MKNADQEQVPHISDDQFEKFVQAIVDYSHLTSTGKINIDISVEQRNELSALLGLPPNDNRTIFAVLEALSNRMQKGCGVIHEGGCTGSVTHIADQA